MNMIESRLERGKTGMRIYFCLAVGAILVLLSVGHFSPDGSGDTWAYALAGHLGYPDFLAYPRTPFYGWFLRAAGWHNATVAPAIQILLYIIALGLFVAELGRRLTLASQTGVAIASLFSTALLLDSNRLLPELGAISAAILAFCGCLAVARAKPWGFALILCGAGMAYFLRPIFLPIIAAIPILLFYFSEHPRRLRNAALGLIFAALPFLGYSSLRAAAVGDFNVVSFGGYQASPMATMLLDDKLVSRLDSDNRALANAILAGVAKGEKSGAILPIPVTINDRQSSFNTTAVLYPDAIAVAYDQIGFVVSKQKQPGEGYVAFDRRLMRFDLAVIKLAPGKLLLWMVGQTARLVGQAVMTNISMAIAFFLVLIALGLGRKGDPSDKDMEALLVINLAWLIASGLLAVSASFAATRYINTAGMFLPALPAYWALRRCDLDRLERYLASSGSIFRHGCRR